MNKNAIEIKNLSKSYRVQSGSGMGSRSLRDWISDRVRLKKLSDKPEKKPDFETFWALKEINLSMEAGTVMGVIGGNGAGKSTLLKLLSRITEPTSGRVTIRGRVSSMLEVGTGFHPELSGRENVFLNGIILGMKHAEIKKQFDEIVEFSEIGEFIDLPLKRYSTGMGLRLAFAVAAHLRTDILIVDEILAVGDAQFQKKCIGKMKEISQGAARTILFVSHNMSVIQSLCNRCILLKKGNLIEDGSPSKVVQSYLQFGGQSASFQRPPQECGTPTLVVGRVIPMESNGEWVMEVCLSIQSGRDQKVAVQMALRDSTGLPIGYGALGYLNPSEVELKVGLNDIRFQFSLRHLAMGGYWLTLSILSIISVDITALDHAENVLFFEWMPKPEANASRILNQAWGVGSLHFDLTRLEK
jgi:lipopolysaccharide transport system ATP-binding protein